MGDLKFNKKWFHFIGICGVTMAPTAKMLEDMGHFVTGSDKGIFPPMSDYIKKNGLKMELGYKEEHLCRKYYEDKYRINLEISDKPDFIVSSGFIGDGNLEMKIAMNQNILNLSFAEVLEKYLVKEESIVVVGTYGKTTTAAALVWIMQQAGLAPSYMIGAVANNFEHGVKNKDSKWSVIEGDEYISSSKDRKSKFFHYKPKYLLLTSIEWDHTDVFKNEGEYIENFKELVRSVPKDGLIVACVKSKNVKEVIKDAKCRVVTYYPTFETAQKEIDANYIGTDYYTIDTNGKSFLNIRNKEKEHPVEINTDLIGQFNLENLLGAYALASEIGLEESLIKNAISTFTGIRRRLEIVFQDVDTIVIEDFASAPAKVKGSIDAIVEYYNKKLSQGDHLRIIYEPNTGGRTKDAMPLYKNLFEKADEVLIPRLRVTKANKDDYRIGGQKLADLIRKDHKNVKYLPRDDELINYLITSKKEGDIFVFMGSGGFRGMISEFVGKLESN